MKPTHLSVLLLTLSCSAALLATPASAIGMTGTRADYGSEAPASAATETIRLSQDTKYVNVNNGDTVDFISNGKSFTWHFDTFPGTTSLDLSQLGAKQLHADHVRVYIGANPLYQG